jgi:hypothetical protein
VEKSHAPNDRKAGPPSPSFRRKRCGVEKSPFSDGTGGITAGDLSTQSIIGAVTVCPIPTRSPARDDGGGKRPSRHFDRSVAEWRNLLPLMVRAALRREISRLRASSERLPSAPYRHATPLEMTVPAGTPIVISTAAERSGVEKSHSTNDRKAARALSSFRPKRSGVEKSHSTMVHEALRQEISRLRVSSKRLPSVSHTGTQPRSR